MQIGYKLRQIREEKKMSQQEVAYYLKISQKTYSNIEGDKSTPSLIQLSKLGEFLDFDILIFLKEQGIAFDRSNNELEDDIESHIIRNVSEKLIEQYEARIKIKQELIALLREQIILLQTKLQEK